MTDQNIDFDRAPWLLKVLVTAAGLGLMSAALGVIPLEPGRMVAPHWVVFTAGLIFLLMGILLFIGRHRLSRPAAYMFVAALMCSAFMVVMLWVAVLSTGPFSGGVSIGPIDLPAPPSRPGILPRIMFGIGALLTGAICALAWVRWWRALHGKPVNLKS